MKCLTEFDTVCGAPWTPRLVPTALQTQNKAQLYIYNYQGEESANELHYSYS